MCSIEIDGILIFFKQNIYHNIQDASHTTFFNCNQNKKIVEDKEISYKENIFLRPIFFYITIICVNFTVAIFFLNKYVYISFCWDEHFSPIYIKEHEDGIVKN